MSLHRHAVNRSAPAVLVRIPAALRRHTRGADMVAIDGDNVRAVLAALCVQYPGIAEHLLESDGKLRRFIDIYLGSANIERLRGLDTRLETDDVLAIIPGRPEGFA